MSIEPMIRSEPGFTVVGLELHAAGDPEEIPRLWGEAARRVTEIGDRAGPEAYGVTYNFNPATREFDYLAGFRVDRPGEIPPGMRAYALPPQRYAVFRCTLPTLMDTLHQANHMWLPASTYRRADGPEFEFYGTDFNPEDPQSPMYLYIPIEER